jgi:hypothetical protein
MKCLADLPVLLVDIRCYLVLECQGLWQELLSPKLRNVLL